jgi:hypothetical protein
MKDYNPEIDYVKASDDFKRDNLREYLKTLDRKELVSLLFDQSQESDVKLDKWDIQTLASLVVDLKFGKEED